MRRQSQEEVAAAARRRLELLGRELDQAGLRRVDDGDARSRDVAEERGIVAGAVDGGTSRSARSGVAARRHAAAGQLGGRPGPGDLAGSGRAGPRAGAAGGGCWWRLRWLPRRTSCSGRAASPRPCPTDRRLPSLRDESPIVPSPAATGASPAGGGEDVTVDVAGKVRRPGVTTLPAGSRVADALQKAGGPRGRVDLSALNLARILVDGEQILVGRAGPPGGIGGGRQHRGSRPGGCPGQHQHRDPEQLETLPGVGPVTAQKILDWRGAQRRVLVGRRAARDRRHRGQDAGRARPARHAVTTPATLDRPARAGARRDRVAGGTGCPPRATVAPWVGARRSAVSGSCSGVVVASRC